MKKITMRLMKSNGRKTRIKRGDFLVFWRGRGKPYLRAYRLQEGWLDFNPGNGGRIFFKILNPDDFETVAALFVSQRKFRIQENSVFCESFNASKAFEVV